MLFVSFQAFSKTNCAKHPIFCQIKKNAPHLDSKYAMKLSNVIYKMHKKHNIPRDVFTAILRQESGYSLEARGCHWGIPVGGTEAVKTCADFGIAQINWKTAERYGFDLNKLTTDLEYSVEAGAIVLRDFMKRFKKKDLNWWTRYNCGNRGKTTRDTCVIYRKLVGRYM